MDTTLDNMYFVVVSNYLNFHRNSEDVHNSNNNKTTADRVRNAVEFITAKVEEMEGYTFDYTVFCTGHSLGGLFAEYLTLNCPKINQCETFNSAKEQYDVPKYGDEDSDEDGAEDEEFDEAIDNEVKAIKSLYK
jgi:poly(3-hydroxybutyrate) depolymerase